MLVLEPGYETEPFDVVLIMLGSSRGQSSYIQLALRCWLFFTLNRCDTVHCTAKYKYAILVWQQLELGIYTGQTIVITDLVSIHIVASYPFFQSGRSTQ